MTRQELYTVVSMKVSNHAAKYGVTNPDQLANEIVAAIEEYQEVKAALTRPSSDSD